MKSESKGRVAIVQARMGSTRFPNKTLAEIAGKPMLGHVLDRLQRCRRIDGIVVATTDRPGDDPIERYARERGISCFRGSESDVLDRYARAAREANARIVIRVTADCPLLDPRVVDRAVEEFERREVDYLSNILRYSYPEGLDVEVFSMNALETAWKNAEAPLEREHVTPYLRSHPNIRRHNLEREKDLSHLHLNWSVDREEDLHFVAAVLESLDLEDEGSLRHETVVDLLTSKPELAAMLASRIRNEGYYLGILKDGRKAPEAERSLLASESWHDRSKRVIPLATQTFSKAADQYVRGVAPMFLQKGKGAKVWDVDGNEYIDYVMALCPLILGYADEKVDRAAKRQLRDGISFSLPHPVEVELAEKLTELIPGAEMVRFGKNGSDATAGAVRAARAYTGREVIACCGYHGWQDWFVGTTARHQGVPEAVRKLTVPFTYNDIASLEKIFRENSGKVAAVILEPIGVEEPRDGFLEKVQALAKKNGALLIFDEIITGFRLALGGAQEYFGVVPDLACFGKAMANGYPLSAVVGRRDVMEIFEKVFYSFTFGGEAVSLAAALETIRQLESRKAIPRIWEQGRRLMDGVNVFARELGLEGKVRCVGLPPRSIINFYGKDEEESRLWKSLFQQEVLKRGILFAGGHNPSLAHGEAEIEATLFAYRDAMKILAEAIRGGTVREALEGEPVQPVFRKA